MATTAHFPCQDISSGQWVARPCRRLACSYSSSPYGSGVPCRPKQNELNPVDSLATAHPGTDCCDLSRSSKVLAVDYPPRAVVVLNTTDRLLKNLLVWGELLTNIVSCVESVESLKMRHVADASLPPFVTCSAHLTGVDVESGPRCKAGFFKQTQHSKEPSPKS